MLDAKRVFSTINTNTGMMKWYFQAREGNIGPFSSRAEALYGMREFIQAAAKTGDVGGRNLEHDQLITSSPVKQFLKYNFKYS